MIQALHGNPRHEKRVKTENEGQGGGGGNWKKERMLMGEREWKCAACSGSQEAGRDR